jgi:ribonuclease HI
LLLDLVAAVRMRHPGIELQIIDEAGEAKIIKESDRPGFQQVTNQEMELEACIVALDEVAIVAIRGPDEVG